MSKSTLCSPEVSMGVTGQKNSQSLLPNFALLCHKEGFSGLKNFAA